MSTLSLHRLPEEMIAPVQHCELPPGKLPQPLPPHTPQVAAQQTGPGRPGMPHAQNTLALAHAPEGGERGGAAGASMAARANGDCMHPGSQKSTQRVFQTYKKKFPIATPAEGASYFVLYKQTADDLYTLLASGQFDVCKIATAGLSKLMMDVCDSIIKS